ncbi:MAG: zinc ribbon domain-containing protein [Bacillota bacterium]
MPIWEFRCAECAHKFEVLVISSKRDELTCPRCGSFALKKLLSAFAFRGSSGSSPKDCGSCSGKNCSTCK